MTESLVASTASTARASTNQVLCFHLAGQEYAIDILQVCEIRRFVTPTALPDVPHYVLGVFNLRGTVVPVFDLRRRFGMDPVLDRNTAIIVVTVGARTIGLVVDDVKRVQNVSPEMIRPTPPLAGSIDSSFLIGLIAAGDRLVTWLDVVQLLGADLEAT